MRDREVTLLSSLGRMSFTEMTYLKKSTRAIRIFDLSGRALVYEKMNLREKGNQRRYVLDEPIASTRYISMFRERPDVTGCNRM